MMINDYYPFGMLVPNRNYQSPSYRYGFQGQEKDDEVKGNGNSLNYKFRMHDPRVGRFFAIDPLTKKYPFYSPYSFSGNKVIAYRELEGGEDLIAIVPNNKSTLFLTIDGDKIYELIATQSLEYFGERAKIKSYSIAYRTLKEGKLMGTDGKIHNSMRMVVKEVNLIDGSIVKVEMGRGKGNKYFSTNAVNQMEAFKSKRMYNNGLAVVKYAGDFIDVVGFVKATIDNGGQIPADSLLEFGVTAYAVEALGTGGTGLAAGALFGILNDKAKEIANMAVDAERESIIGSNASVDKVEHYLSNLVTFKHNISIIRMQSNVLNDYITGKIKTFDDLMNAIESDENSNIDLNSAIMVEYVDEKVILVHKIYIDTTDSKPLEDSKK